MMGLAAPVYQLPVAPHPQLDALRNDNARFEPIPEPPKAPASTPPRAEVDDYDRSRATAQPRETPADRQATLDPRAISNNEQPAENNRGNREQRQQQRQEQIEIQDLAARDRSVRAHEAAHAAVGGQYAGAPSYRFQRGPDGQSYAVSGEVPIDASAVPGDSEATIRKLQTVRNAALAPADPSAQDRRVAAQATSRIARARAELAVEQRTQTETSSSTETTTQTGETQSALPGSTVSVGSDTLYVSCPFCSKPHLPAVAHTVTEPLSSSELSARLKSRGVLLPEDRISIPSVFRRAG